MALFTDGGAAMQASNIGVTQQGVDAAAIQKLLDYVADRLAGTDFATAERLFDEFVERLRKLDDIAAVRRSIAAADTAALEHLGGVEDARNLIALIEKFG